MLNTIKEVLHELFEQFLGIATIAIAILLGATTIGLSLIWITKLFITKILNIC